MEFSFDGTNLNDGVTYKVTHASRVFHAPARPSLVTPLLSRSGGVVTPILPGPRSTVLEGRILAANADAWNDARDALLTVLTRPKRRLVATLDGSTRYNRATLQAFEAAAYQGERGGTFTAEFLAEDAYDSAATPSGDVQTPTLALLPGSTTRYGTTYTLTPGGSAPVEPRIYLLNRTGGVTPILLDIRNLETGQGLTVNTLGGGGGPSLPAGSLLLVDASLGIFAGPQTNTVAWWSCADADGAVQDFGPNNLALTENGTVTYRQDGPLGVDVALSGWSASNFLDSASATFQLTSALTICCWVYTGASITTTVPLSKAGSNQGYALLYDATSIYYIFGTGAGIGFAVAGGGLIVANTWYFLCGTHNQSANRSRLYLGKQEQPPRLIAAGTAPAIVSSSNNLRLGAGHNPSGGLVWPLPSTGRLSLPAVYNTELTAEQIRRIWQRGPGAYIDSPVYAPPNLVLDPGAGPTPPPNATNRVQIRGDDESTAPLFRTAFVWRSRYN